MKFLFKDKLSNIKNYLLVIISILLVPSIVKAETVVYHVTAYHTNNHYTNWEYNSQTTGVGFKLKNNKTITLGTYRHSYFPEGKLDGAVVYASKTLKSLKLNQNVTLQNNVALTYGYPEWLKDNYKGLMLVPNLTLEVANKHYGVLLSAVPGQWSGGDNAYLLSFEVK